MRRLTTSLLGICLLVSAFLFTNGCERAFMERTYRIGRDTTFAPLNFLGKEKNLVGFIDDLIYSIAYIENFGVDLGTSPRGRMEENLRRGIYDGVITLEAPTSRLAQMYEFSDPFYDLGPVLIVPIDSDAESLDDMRSKVIGIERTASIIYNVPEIPDIIFTPFENILFAFRNLSEGHIDGVIMDAFPASEYLETFYKGMLKVIPPPLTEHGLRLMTLKTPNGNDLVKRFNDGLKKMREESEYNAILEKWRLTDLSTYTGVPQTPAQ